MSLCPALTCSVFLDVESTREIVVPLLNVSLEPEANLELPRTFHGVSVHPNVHFTHMS